MNILVIFIVNKEPKYLLSHMNYCIYNSTIVLTTVSFPPEQAEEVPYTEVSVIKSIATKNTESIHTTISDEIWK